MKNLIIGAGEVGTALREIFAAKHDTYLRDVEGEWIEGVELLHICFPHSTGFVGQVRNYIAQYQPQLTIIHSSVPVGTTDLCGPHVVHSPIRGRHPNLAKEMPLFKKFVGGRDMNDVDKACAFFEACGWQTQSTNNPETTEALKLLSNVHMALEVAWRQEVERIGVDPEMYAAWEKSYFHGYLYFGQMHLVRPQLKPDPIGGHCLLECVDLLSKTFESKLFDFIVESNEKAKEAKHENRHQDAVA